MNPQWAVLGHGSNWFPTVSLHPLLCVGGGRDDGDDSAVCRLSTMLIAEVAARQIWHSYPMRNHEAS